MFPAVTLQQQRGYLVYYLLFDHVFAGAAVRGGLVFFVQTGGGRV